MNPDNSGYSVSDVVVSARGRDQGAWFYVVGLQGDFLLLANGKNRTLEAPKRKKQKHVEKVLRSETRVAEKSFPATKCSTANYEETWLFRPGMQANNLGG